MLFLRYPFIKIIFVAAVFLFLAGELYARAGGGGGGGGGGRSSIIGLIVALIWAGIASTVLFVKTSKSQMIINWAYRTDRIWDSNRMHGLAKNIFLKMQRAWMNRDLEPVREFISDGLYEDYTQQLNDMRSNHEKNILEQITVTDVRIISCEDYKDNSRDSFIAYIKGKMVDYTIDDRTREVIKNEEREPEGFTDTYHFVRKGNKWVLNFIDNDVSMGDLLRASNYKERQRVS